MSRIAIMLVLMPLAALPGHAQEAGDARAGAVLARTVCASCHAVREGETNSPARQAPSFERIAHVPGMTPMALTVALQTSHKEMPNLMLDAKETRDVIAYITSLQENR